MSITPYQIIVPVLSLIAMLYAWSLMLRRKKTIWEALLWTLFWGVIGYIAINPKILSYLSNTLGFKSQENAIMVTAIGILFFMLFYLIVRLEELEQRQTKLVRKIALRDAGLATKDSEES